MEKRNSQQVYKTIMLIIITVLITALVTTIVIYNFVIKSGKIAIKSEDNSSLSGLEATLASFRSVLEEKYMGEIDDEALIEGAIKGYVSALGDPYTTYYTKEEMDELMEETTGNYVGIGIYMVKDTENNQIMVLSPIKNSPAEKAGIQPGDYIIEVDGKQCTGDDFSTISNEIKGEVGSTVKLKIKREDKTLDFEIKRENVTVNPVEGKVLEGNIGYIEFSSFDEDTAEEFKNKFNELKSNGITSLIIDLRNNGGGIVDEALEIAGYAVDKGTTLLYEVDKDGKETEEKSKVDKIIDMPIVILVNENTASSSEILAGALKDLGKAKIVGTKTYGKGVIQQILTLGDGSGLKITTEEYLTPNRTKINKVGIEPDEKVELPETVKNILSVEEKDDTQLQKAIELLK